MVDEEEAMLCENVYLGIAMKYDELLQLQLVCLVFWLMDFLILEVGVVVMIITSKIPLKFERYFLI